MMSTYLPDVVSIRCTPVRRVSVKVLSTWPSAGGAVGKAVKSLGSRVALEGGQ